MIFTIKHNRIEIEWENHDKLKRKSFLDKVIAFKIQKESYIYICGWYSIRLQPVIVSEFSIMINIIPSLVY